ncbi:MAG TPA: type II toxin-antitoxin system PemK/MazF family toxin [Candidatus Nanoarchaeia archaeon]|nr:type II toxin-antitoxin system PemK/MazF family toxin [Candidatus Nanoarchaeia archaeon]
MTMVLDSSKVRPAIIVSNNAYNESFGDILAVPLTTNLELREYAVLLTPKDLEQGRLIKESKIKVDKLFSVEKKLVRLIIGKISQKKFSAIQKMIYELIAA